MKILKTTDFYTKKLLRSHPTKLFVFGDNLMRVGKGGQAAIRDEENAQGVATKASPTTHPKAFFYDASLHHHIGEVMNDLELLREMVNYPEQFDAIVIPFTDEGEISLGTGLAALPTTSPITYRLVCAYLNSLADEHGGWGELDG